MMLGLRGLQTRGHGRGPLGTQHKGSWVPSSPRFWPLPRPGPGPAAESTQDKRQQGYWQSPDERRRVLGSGEHLRVQCPRPEGAGPQCFPAERVWALLASSAHSPGRTHVALTRHLLAAGLGAGLSEASVSPPVWQWPLPSSLLHPYPFLPLHAAPGWAHCAPCWSHAPPEEGGEGWERGLGTGRRVPGVVFGCGFGREGEGLRDCCFYNNLTNWRAEARWGLPDHQSPSQWLGCDLAYDFERCPEFSVVPGAPPFGAACESLESYHWGK